MLLKPSPPCRSEGGVLRLDTVGSLIRSRLKRLQYEEESQCRLSPAEECVDMDNMDDAREERKRAKGFLCLRLSSDEERHTVTISSSNG